MYPERASSQNHPAEVQPVRQQQLSAAPAVEVAVAAEAVPAAGPLQKLYIIPMWYVMWIQKVTFWPPRKGKRSAIPSLP